MSAVPRDTDDDELDVLGTPFDVSEARTLCDRALHPIAFHSAWGNNS